MSKNSLTWVLIKISIFSLFALLFSYISYIRYWKYSDCIEIAKSSCYTKEGDILISGGIFWTIPSIIFIFLVVKNIFSIKK